MLCLLFIWSYIQRFGLCASDRIFLTFFSCSLPYVSTNTIYWRSTRILSKQNKMWVNFRIKMTKKWIKICKEKKQAHTRAEGQGNEKEKYYLMRGNRILPQACTYRRHCLWANRSEYGKSGEYFSYTEWVRPTQQYR